MKTLVLVRHAKSSWDDPNLSDRERPLNKRGERDAPFMADLIKKINVIPDIIYSSPATRALTTSKMFASVFNYNIDKIEIKDSIYEFGFSQIINLISHSDNKFNTIFLFGHNPDITAVSSYLSNKHFENVPTCGVVGIEFDFERWDSMAKNSGKIKFYEYPKKYFK